MPQEFMIEGRVVFGHPLKSRPKKNIHTKQAIMKDGQPVVQYVFGVAIEKNRFNTDVLPRLQNEARTAFPNGTPSNFTFKYKDGDSVDTKGQPYNKREGYGGHCVLTVSTEGFAPQVYKFENGAYRQLSENEIKCGDYVAVKVMIKYNGATSPNTPGLYINPQGVILTGYGQEIVSASQDPDEMFAGYVPTTPAGASATPVMGHAPLPSGMATGVNPTSVPPQGMQYMTSSPAVTAPLPAPAHDFVNAALGTTPPAPPAPPAVFPPAGWTAHPSAPGYYYKDQQVLTEAQLRALPPALPGLPTGR